MQPRKQNAGPRPQRAPQGRRPQYWYTHHCPPYYYDWYDYDWYDYDWYDYDYDSVDYEGYSVPEDGGAAPSKIKRSTQRQASAAKPAEYTEAQSAYQQGFKDGWRAAINYMINGIDPNRPTEPTPPQPTPMPPSPMEGAAE